VTKEIKKYPGLSQKFHANSNYQPFFGCLNLVSISIHFENKQKIII
jgi:hypothetical protein